MRFAEIKGGEWFTDGKNTYLKLQTALPNGIQTEFYNKIGDIDILFNSVDQSGNVARCLDWLDYELVEKI